VHCPFCPNGDTQVSDSRLTQNDTVIRRRRRCISCDKRFTTYERFEHAFPAVVKKEGYRVAFDAQKLIFSMQLALRKRPVSTQALDNAVANIEYQLLATGQREIHSEKIGELVMQALWQLDTIAYIRFASVYRRFEDIGEFQKLIKEIKKR
jgi:transcriptional repressor NrdR